MDLLYSFFKITSMIATGLFGALGLLTKYRDAEGKITRWGKVALGGILISSGISLGLYVLETARAKAKAIEDQAKAVATGEKLETILVNAQTTAEQQKRSLEETNTLKLGLEKALERSDYIAKGMENSLAGQQSVLSGNKMILGGVTDTVKKQGELLNLNTGTLNEVSRGLYPIKAVRITYWLRVPMDHEHLRAYRERIEREAPLLPQLNTGVLQTDSFTTMNMAGNVEKVTFWGKSILAPHKASEKLAYTLFSASEMELDFFKIPINPNDHPRATGRQAKKPDLKLSAYGYLAGGTQSIDYDMKSKQFQLIGYQIPVGSQYWESSGDIIGIPDLQGAQMFVLPSSLDLSGDNTLDQYLHGLRKRFELEALTVFLSDGREFWFGEAVVEGRRHKGGHLEKHEDKDGYPFYSFIFPKTLAELRQLEQ
jgi:hypothetical protein